MKLYWFIVMLALLCIVPFFIEIYQTFYAWMIYPTDKPHNKFVGVASITFILFFAIWSTGCVILNTGHYYRHKD